MLTMLKMLQFSGLSNACGLFMEKSPRFDHRGCWPLNWCDETSSHFQFCRYILTRFGKGRICMLFVSTNGTFDSVGKEKRAKYKIYARM